MNLYFKDYNDKYTLVKENLKREEAVITVAEFAKKFDPEQTIYYIRSWGDEDRTTFDYGSHSQFFILTKEKL